jgi:hypothetical protein
MQKEKGKPTKLESPSKIKPPMVNSACLPKKQGQSTLHTSTQTNDQSGTRKTTCAPGGSSINIASTTANTKRAMSKPMRSLPKTNLHEKLDQDVPLQQKLTDQDRA